MLLFELNVYDGDCPKSLVVSIRHFNLKFLVINELQTWPNISTMSTQSYIVVALIVEYSAGETTTTKFLKKKMSWCANPQPGGVVHPPKPRG